MPLRLDRRAVLVTAGIALPAYAILPRSPLAADSGVFAQIEQANGGRLGISALNTETGARLAYRADERFALCSTFKWLLAATVLASVDRGAMRLEARIPYTHSDLIMHAPTTTQRVEEGAMSVADLCEAAVTVGDNTAGNLLLAAIGGPAGLTAFLRGQGDGITRLDRKELDLNTNLPDDVRDTTTPAAMIATMNKFLLGDALTAPSKDKLLGWMKACRTGQNRLRAGLPGDWIVGDKTGSGANGATNDVAIAWPPGKRPVLMAAYYTGSDQTPARCDEVHAQVARAIVAAFTRK